MSILTDEQVSALRETVGTLADLGARLTALATEFRDALADVDMANDVRPSETNARVEHHPAAVIPAILATPEAPTDGDRAASTDERLPMGQRKILSVLSQYPSGRRKNQVALLAGYAVRVCESIPLPGTARPEVGNGPMIGPLRGHFDQFNPGRGHQWGARRPSVRPQEVDSQTLSGGGFNNALSALRSRGRIAGTKESLHITDDGLAVLGTWAPLPTGHALVEHWLGTLAKAERAILQTLVAA